MTQGSKKLGCPKCVGLLGTKEVGEMEGVPIHIDQCPMCMGIWFDEGELDKLLKLKISFDSEKASEEFHSDLRDSDFDLKEAKCPRCEKVMNRVRSGRDDRVITDYCLECGGTWLDGGEIRYLMRGGPLERSVQFVLKKVTAPFKALRSQRQPRPQ